MQGQQLLGRRTILKWTGLVACVGFTNVLLAACGGAQDALALEISCDGNNLAFDKTTLTAPAGQRVRLTFNNISTAFHHNWVLVAGGDAIADQVNLAATAAGPRLDYLPNDKSLILAHTALTAQGESDTISFTTPEEAGQYVYLCTFPGHYLAGMKGILTVTA